MTIEEAMHHYNELFNEADKANAFDRIAKEYYLMNFGSMSKSEMDVLMFSLFIERILDTNPEDFSLYSDYTLSKQLGITQTRISNLKVRKELTHPRAGYDWKKLSV